MIQLWLGGLALLVVQGALWRALFWFLYHSPATATGDLPAAFLLGARFDLTVACYAFTVPTLVWLADRWIALIPAVDPIRRKIANVLKPLLVPGLAILFAIVTFVSLIDAGYYSFYQDRLNVLVFGFVEDDTWALVKTMWKNYPVIWMVLGLVAVIAGQTIALKKLAGRSRVIAGATGAVLALAIFFANGLGARGSVGLFPLSEIDTHISSDEFVNLVAYNPIHAFSRAIQNKMNSRSKWNSNLDLYGYGDDARQAWADCFGVSIDAVPADPRALMHKKSPKNAWASATRPHVVIVVMESLGGYWFKYDQEPFDLAGGLKPILAREPNLMTFLSATGATIGSLSSLMAGVPHRPASDFLTEGQYLSTPLRSAPARVFKNAGYDTRFVYAGNPGWRDIGKYAHTQGFDVVEGDVEIENALGRRLEHHDWGIFDADVFDHVKHVLEKAQKPQMILIMTTANHPPYQLPAGAAEPKLQVPAELDSRLLGDRAVAHRRLVTFRYSNDRLADFMNDVDKEPFAEKTVIAATGDHGFWIVGFSEAEQLAKSSVPLILKLPPSQRRAFPKDTYGMHADLWPTLYHLTLSEADYDSAAVDLMDPAAPRYAYNGGNLILGAAGAVFIAPKPADDHDYDWREGLLVPAAAQTAAHKAMGLRYRCLMGLLDDFFHRERLGRETAQ